MTTEIQNSSSGTPRLAKTLLLMRHAKSDWGDSGLSDHDRPLNRRGMRDAPRMADWLRSTTGIPDLILSSTALRTRQSVQQMTQAWDQDPATEFRESLYLASAESILNTIASQSGDADCVMVVAHNPGISHLVSQLSGQSIEMPTAAIAVIRLTSCSWHQISASAQFELAHWMRPKSLDEC